MSRGQYIDPAAGRITFREYGEKWLASLTTDVTTRSSVEVQIRKHAFPYLGTRPLESFRPEHIRDWLSELEQVLPVSSYRRVIFASVSAVLAAAVDDELLAKNPCKARTVRAPAPVAPRVRPWTPERLFAIRAALPKRYRAMADGGLGLRQGEIFGLPDDPDDFRGEWLRVANPVKVANGHLVFGPPKREKERDVPLPRRIAQVLREYREEFPLVDVTLPWLKGRSSPSGCCSPCRVGVPCGGPTSTRGCGSSPSCRPASFRSLGRVSVTRLRASTGCTRCGTSTRPSCWTPGRTSRR
ncbi:Putative prophage phiRv2 integrase [Streptomyces sp. ADI95-16]|uniref:site-specific integrase n=1 Tax=Streptomyces sp. ADI95-16 TaxID=1522758 RepID=UPI000F433698|nr:site-specific integrase [Streptomyces sp. ADI95-16]AYV27474.1 Putative prophage phiRv2 integrase [Streptomyces sp. ADI95-16]